MVTRAHFWCMVELLLWGGVGALVGSLVGYYRCSDINRLMPKLGHAAHVGICGVVGALACSLVFLALARFVYGVNPF